MLELKNIHKQYSAGGTEVSALKDITLAFRDNEFVSILGPSGCGKTTMLNIIGGLDRYTSGDLIINGRSTKEYRDADWDTYRNHSIGFVFQSYNLIPHQTVLSNVELALTLSGVSKSERRKRATEALQKVGLGDQLHKKPSQMSGGQMQRVAIARALVNDPDILLADEPTGALDTTTSIQIMEILKEISHNKLIIMVTHNPELAEQYSTRIVRLLDGDIVGDTMPFDVAAQSSIVPNSAKTAATRLNTDLGYLGKPYVGISYDDVEDTGTSGSGSESDSQSTAKTTTTDATRSHANSAAADQNMTSGRNTASRSNANTPISRASASSASQTQGSRDSRSASRKNRKTRKPSMSFFTALSLSANNLLTKKGRTFMTAFAGSIGIIGIALILALSTGVQSYIDDVQRDTLSSYPILIEKEQADMTSLMEALSGQKANDAETHEHDAVYSSSQMYDMFNALFHAETTENNLTDFKEWLDAEMNADTSTTELYDHVSTVQYQYNTKLNTYVLNENDRYINTDFRNTFVTGGDKDESTPDPMAAMVNTSQNNVNLWQEILPGQDGALISDVIYDQYDLVYGSWPDSADEIVLILDKRNEVSDLAFYALGQVPKEEMNDIMSSAMKQEKIEVIDRRMDYEAICDIPFKLLLNTDYYAKSADGETWEYIGDDEARMDLVIKNGYDLKISGIIRPKEEATSTALVGPFAYTTALTSHIIESTRESELAQAQLLPENENLDVLTGLPFIITNEIDPTDDYKADEITAYFKSLTDAEKCELYEKMISEPSEDYIEETLASYMEPYETREEIENMISEAYGMDSETISEYLESYSDEELKDLMAEQFTAMIKEQYAAAAREQVAAIRNTPSEEELAGISARITEQLTDLQTKIGFITAAWTETTSMTPEAIAAYLYSLPADQLEAAVQEVAAAQAMDTYADFAGMDAEAADAKVAAAFDAQMLSVTDKTTLADWYDRYMPSTVSGSTYADNLEKLGILDLASPKGIFLYSKTFEDKDFIADVISQYNRQVEEEKEIKYTDYVALLMSGVTGIINAVSYGLIAFVGISLVVSSIMIGIITYISVLERTKEIGILRSIGASKKDISRVFNAETLIVGFSAGALGIIVSLLVCIPANILIYQLTDVTGINIHLPVAACVILIAISMILTSIAGVIPARVAAKKDPVEALRSE